MAEQKFEDVINEALNGDLQKNALDFVKYLRDNEMTVAGAKVSYKGNAMCYMHLDGEDEEPGPWTIWSEGDYSGESTDFPIDERMKEIAWEHVNICGSCGSCKPGKRKTIFGKEFDNVCNADIAFYKPNAEELECVIKLLDMRKSDINKKNMDCTV